MLRTAKKAFFKLVHMNPWVDRFVRYRNPHDYWRKRGGETYFGEQEAVCERTLRSDYIADRMKKYSHASLLEIGCGYGKQLKNLYLPGLMLAGCDYSRPQILKAKEYFPQVAPYLVEADAASIPFASKSFDAVFSSAVILHNHYKKAQSILAEMIRISRRYLVHNEDTDITFSRFGYDMKKTYEKLNFRVLESGPIPCEINPSATQFTVVEIPSTPLVLNPQEIPLQYH